ncbi:MAG: ABC transporter permease [Caldilineaceae bacterium SB0662_bin_9]|uniref:ABC transporter permease n=1 Tax=Caldilineaceae bacterium SB0662_bin_9 TaxID=2605258 RepID=A0A6B1DRU1_9CHLR|nr:ABC transporter permease [Caldilineaceae bacterium SB0666_bin_21]MYD89442.1 ABC transporter permease [Caldilineaceae bacterium SB0662_bin_9]
MQATPNPAFRPLTEVSTWQRLRAAMRRFRTVSPLGTVALIGWILLFVIAIGAPILAPYPPNEADYSAVRQGPSAKHLLGTDNLGRDILSRIIHGARITLLVSVTSVFLGDAIGFVWGVISGFLGHRFDLFSQRVIDILMSFPSLILALMLLVVLGAGIETVIVAIASTQIPAATRITRSVVLSVREAMYVEAARSIGVNNLRLMVRHVAPQVAAPILVVATLHLGGAIFAESALSFLGLGIPPPAPSWGNMLGGVTAAAFKPPWWLVVFPGLAITLTIMAANLFGDALRDFLDPKLRQRID